jgi:ribosomal protein L7/L12
MKSYPAPPIPADLVTRFRLLVESGEPQQEVIAKMRLAGLHKIQSIKLVSEFYQMPVGEAKQMVHRSDTWSDRRESDEAFHEVVFEAAKQLAIEEVNEPRHEPVSR